MSSISVLVHVEMKAFARDYRNQYPVGSRAMALTDVFLVVVKALLFARSIVSHLFQGGVLAR